MKAKEYLIRFEKDSQELGDKIATTNLMDGFLDETQSIAKTRSAQSNEAIISIFLELNNKWNALCRLDRQGRFRKDGFIRLVRHRTVDVFPQIIFHLDKIIEERFHLEEVPK